MSIGCWIEVGMRFLVLFETNHQSATTDIFRFHKNDLISFKYRVIYSGSLENKFAPKAQWEKHVAQMIDSGASLKDVDRWHQMRFGKKLPNRLKENYKTWFLGVYNVDVMDDMDRIRRYHWPSEALILKHLKLSPNNMHLISPGQSGFISGFVWQSYQCFRFSNTTSINDSMTWLSFMI